MLFLVRVIPTLLAALSLVEATTVVPRAKDKFVSQFIRKLYEEGLTVVADNYERITSTEEGKEIVDILKSGPLTILAPNNQAFDSYQSNITTDVLKYCMLPGSIDNGFKTVSHYRRYSQTRSTAKSTMKRSSAPSPKNKSGDNRDENLVQVIDQFRPTNNRKRGHDDQQITIDQSVGSTKMVYRFSFKEIIILVVDKKFDLPPTVSELLRLPLTKSTPNGFPKWLEALEKAGLKDLVDTKDELTMFVPTDESLGDIDHLSNDELTSFLNNHFFIGKILYSPLFPSSPSAISQSGKKLEFSVENGVYYVTCGTSRATLVRKDVLSANGVVHTTDKSLKCD